MKILCEFFFRLMKIIKFFLHFSKLNRTFAPKIKINYY